MCTPFYHLQSHFHRHFHLMSLRTLWETGKSACAVNPFYTWGSQGSWKSMLDSSSQLHQWSISKETPSPLSPSPMLTAQCHGPPGPKLKHCSVASFLVVGYKWYIILITYAYFQRKDFTPILCQCYFNVWHYIAGCILLHEKILGKNVCMYLFLQIHSNLRSHDDWKPVFQNKLE